MPLKMSGLFTAYDGRASGRPGQTLRRDLTDPEGAQSLVDGVPFEAFDRLEALLHLSIVGGAKPAGWRYRN